MITVRNEQMMFLRQRARDRFCEEMIAHLHTFSPHLCRTLDEAQLRATVETGIEQASGYGLIRRGPLRLYLEAMLLFGSGFATDPQYPWFGQILKNPAFASDLSRAEALYERIIDYQENVIGIDDSYALNALRSLWWQTRMHISINGADFTGEIVSLITQFYPRKVAYCGSEAIVSLTEKGRDVSAGLGFLTARASALVVILMFAFGHDCVADLLYPWISRTINDHRLSDARARVARLEKKAVTWLEHVLANFDEVPRQ